MRNVRTTARVMKNRSMWATPSGRVTSAPGPRPLAASRSPNADGRPTETAMRGTTMAGPSPRSCRTPTPASTAIHGSRGGGAKAAVTTARGGGLSEAGAGGSGDAAAGGPGGAGAGAGRAAAGAGGAVVPVGVGARAAEVGGGWDGAGAVDDANRGRPVVGAEGG